MRKPNLTTKRAKALQRVLADTSVILASYKRTDPRHAAVEFLRDLTRWKLGDDRAERS